MGWTWTNATTTRNGKIDRKAECDRLMNDEMFRLEKSIMIGSTYYGAVTRIAKRENDQIVLLPESEQYTFGVVYLTSTNIKDYYNFGYKDMDESCGPCYYDCPKSILNLLSPTDNKYALEWRRKCYEKAAEKETKTDIGKLPIGTIIELADGKRFKKYPAGHQFKTPYWFCDAIGKYIPKKYLSNYDFKIISA